MLGALILASESPARRALLERLGVPFTLAKPLIDEHAVVGESPEQTAELRAAAKAADVLGRAPEGSIVIGADQLVDLDGEILGKPGSRDRAVEQLASLSGREHRLLTAVSVQVQGRAPLAHLDVTCLEMHQFERPELVRYVERDRPEQCAGSYRIEGQGIALFRRIVGNDPTAIEGLPLGALATMLRVLRIQVP